MENDNLKIQLDSIQRILSYCITQTYNVLIGNILRKKSCINNIQFKEILQKEYIRITDELSYIYLNYPALACVEEYYSDDDFLWESSFFESLTKEQKQKYASFSVSSFEYAKYIETHTLYNDVLPMFSCLVDAILYERYAKYLMAEIEQYVKNCTLIQGANITLVLAFQILQVATKYVTRFSKEVSPQKTSVYFIMKNQSNRVLSLRVS